MIRGTRDRPRRPLFQCLPGNIDFGILSVTRAQRQHALIPVGESWEGLHDRHQRWQRAVDHPHHPPDVNVPAIRVRAAQKILTHAQLGLDGAEIRQHLTTAIRIAVLERVEIDVGKHLLTISQKIGIPLALVSRQRRMQWCENRSPQA